MSQLVLDSVNCHAAAGASGVVDRNDAGDPEVHLSLWKADLGWLSVNCG